MKSTLQLRRAIAFRQMVAARTMQGPPQPRNYEGVTISDQRRFEDEPEPTEDEQISKFFIMRYLITVFVYRVSLFEASSILRVQKLR